MLAQLWPGGFDPFGLLRLRTSLFSFSPRPLVSRSQGQVGTTPPYCRREPPTRRTSRAVPFGAFSAKPPTSRAIHTAGDTTRTVSAFPAAPYVFTRGHANLLGARFPHHHSRKAGLCGQGLPDPPIARGLHVRRCVKPANAAPYTYGAVSNPARLLGLSRAGALAMCAKLVKRAGSGVRTPPGGPARGCGCARLTRFARDFGQICLC